MARNLLVAKFPFLREDVFLIAQVDASTGKQRLVMQKVNPETGAEEFSDAIDCIHTAVCDIPVEKFTDTIAEGNLEGYSLHLRSSERLPELRLSPEERFKAMCSWVAGIAESGAGALYLQWEIEEYAHLQYPIASRLLRFMARVDPDLIAEYLFYVERACQHEGVRHEVSLVANLIPVLDLIANPSLKVKGLDRIIEIVFDLRPPLSIFADHANLFFLLTHPRSIQLAQQVPHLLEKYPGVVIDEAAILYLLELIALTPLSPIHAAAAQNYFGYIVRGEHVVSVGLSRKYRSPMNQLLLHLLALEALDLSYNHLASIPAEIAKLPSLRWLNLNGNYALPIPEPLQQAGTCIFQDNVVKQTTKKYIFKILLLGDCPAKSTLLYQVATGNFVAQTHHTIGVNFHLKILEIDGVYYNLQLWDFVPAQRFRLLLPSYVLGAKASIIFCDLARVRSLDSLEEWLAIARSHDPQLPVLFCGLRPNQPEDRIVPAGLVRDTIALHGQFEYFEVAFPLGENMDDVFQAIVRAITLREHLR